MFGRHLCRSASVAGFVDEALGAADEVKRCGGDAPIFSAVYAETCARHGKSQEAAAALVAANEVDIAQAPMALVAHAPGDVDATRRWFERALAPRDCLLPVLVTDPLFARARWDAGVRAILDQVPQLHGT